MRRSCDRSSSRCCLDLAGGMRQWLGQGEGHDLYHCHVPPILRSQAQPGARRTGELCRPEDPVRETHRSGDAGGRCRLEGTSDRRSRLSSCRAAGHLLGPARQALERHLRRPEGQGVPGAVRDEQQQRVHHLASRPAGGVDADSRSNRRRRCQPDRLRSLRRQEENRPRLHHHPVLRRLWSARESRRDRVPEQ